VKAGSIEGNKKKDITVIYTPAKNLKKTGDMDVGQVGFLDDKLVRRIHVPMRDNAIVNRLNKTRTVREVDHEQERQERQREEGKRKKAEVIEQKRLADLLLQARQAKAEAKSKGYSFLSEEDNDHAAQDENYLGELYGDAAVKQDTKDNKPEPRNIRRQDDDDYGFGDGGVNDGDDKFGEDDFM